MNTLTNTIRRTYCKRGSQQKRRSITAEVTCRQQLPNSVLQDVVERTLNMLAVAQVSGTVSVSIPTELPQRRGQSLPTGRIFARGPVGKAVELVIKAKHHRQKLLVQVSSKNLEAKDIWAKMVVNCFGGGKNRLFNQHKHLRILQSQFKQLEVGHNPGHIVTETGFHDLARQQLHQQTSDGSGLPVAAHQSAPPTNASGKEDGSKPSPETHAETEIDAPSATSAPDNGASTDTGAFLLLWFAFSHIQQQAEPEVISSDVAVTEPAKGPALSKAELKRIPLNALLQLGLERAKEVEALERQLAPILDEIKCRTVR